MIRSDEEAGRVLNFILRTLFDPGASLKAYLRRAVPLQIGGALLLGFIGLLVQPPPETEAPPLTGDDVVTVAIVFILVAPLVGVAAVWGAMWAIRKFTTDPLTVALITGAFWGAVALILTANIANGLSTAWSFFCFAAAFQVGELTSTRHGAFASGLMQLFYNALPTLLVLIVALAGPEASLPVDPG